MTDDGPLGTHRSEPLTRPRERRTRGTGLALQDALGGDIVRILRAAESNQYKIPECAAVGCALQHQFRNGRIHKVLRPRLWPLHDALGLRTGSISARHRPIRGAHTVCSARLSGIASGGSASHSSHASTAMRRRWRVRLRDVLWRRLFPSPPRRARVRTPANDEQEGSRGAAEDPPRSAEQQPQDGHSRCVDSRAAAAPRPRSPRRRSRCAQACRTWASRPCSTFSRR